MAARKVPLDVKVVAGLGFVGALLLLYCGMVYLCQKDSLPDPGRIVFGLLHPMSPLPVGVYFLAGAAFEIITAWGLLKIRRYAYWMFVIGLTNGALTGVANRHLFTPVHLIGLVLLAASVVWTVVRYRLFYPRQASGPTHG